MLVEIERKVVALSELSAHNENLLLEGKAHTKDEAEQLAVKLRTLKGSLLELQRALHDKQLNIQVRAPDMLRGQVNACAWLACLFRACPYKGKVGMAHTSAHTCFTQTPAQISKRLCKDCLNVWA